MLPVQIYTTDESVWRDAARRLHHATLAAVSDVSRNAMPNAACRASVFVGATQVEPAAIQRAIDAKQHVLAVAEPCLSDATILELETLAARRGVLFAVANPARYLSSRQTVKSQLGAALGSCELVRSHCWECHAAATTTAPLGLPGVLVAELDQAAWLMGRLPKNVFALEHRAAVATSGGRFLQVHLSFCPGMAIVDYCDRLPEPMGQPRPSYRSLSVIGSSGSAQTNDHANSQLWYAGGSPCGVVGGEGVRHLATLLDEFARAVQQQQDVATGRKAWRETADVVRAVLESLRTREVAVVASQRSAS